MKASVSLSLEREGVISLREMTILAAISSFTREL
jgi:hypothetical protein